MSVAAFNLTLHESMREYLGRFYSRMYLERLLAGIAVPASRYFLRVNTLKITREELVYTLREEGLEVFTHPEVHEAVYLKVKGPNTVRVHRGKVFVDYPTAESAYVGANVYAPGVIKVENALPGDQVTVLSPDSRPVAEGVLVMEPDEIFSKRRGKAVEVTLSVFKVESLRDHRAYSDGLIYHQSLPSMIAVKVLAPKPGWAVLDMCASPGGKATHAAQMMGDEGEIVAVDRSEEKVKAIQENARRLGLRSLKTFIYDSRYISEVVGTNSFDAVILDPPCSALGVRPKLRYSRTHSDVIRLANYQRQFLSEAYKVLRHGGLLLYSTCTISPLENELNIVYAARELGFRVKPANYLNVRKPLLGIPGLLFDPVVNDTPGFFVTLLEKP
ncbi:MAG: methyltransferase domain-containing protein [Thermofilum sp.]